jgi:hypothetical protein
MYTVLSKTALPKKQRGTKIIKYKYAIAKSIDSILIIYALYWEGMTQPILYDSIYDRDISEYEWYLDGNGNTVRAHGPENGMIRMNILVGRDQAKLPNTRDITCPIVHINEIPTDNRAINLVCSPANNPIVPQAVRSDRHAPPQIFIDSGINEFPRYLRWSDTAEMFIIESHPVLKKEVVDGIRKKPVVNGTRSKKFTPMEKFADALARLNELDNRATAENGNISAEIVAARKNEYAEIVKAIQIHNGTYVNLNVPDQTKEVTPERKIARGRKAVSRLPEGSGVTQEMMPAYTIYMPAYKNHSDWFEINHARVGENKRWKTTSSKTVSTIEKYRHLMVKYRELFPEVVLPNFPIV